MFKKIAAALAASVVLLSGWLYFQSNKAPEVSFTQARRGRIESTVVTNGKVEPLEWAAARSETAGIISRVLVSKGQSIRKGQPLAVIEARDARSDLAQAQARMAEAQAEIETLTQGGRTSDLASLDADLKRTQLDLEQAKRDLASLQKLQQKNAATAYEVTTAQDLVNRLNSQITTLNHRRSALVSKADLSAAQARLRNAEASAQYAKQRITLATITAPINGEIYQLDARIGTYVNPGDLIASIGIIDKVKVVVYVDEPELGRVKPGMPVTITWDALPEQSWKGVIEKSATQIVPLGTRQVGEVTGVIENPEGTLLPGTNINVSIESEVAQNALTIPKEALRREGAQTGVYVLDGNHVRWKPVKTGISSVTLAQILEGTQEGDFVALPTDQPLKDGDEVTPKKLDSPSGSATN